MGLNLVFENAVQTAFTVFKDFVKPGKYIVSAKDSGWGEAVVPVEYEMEVIVNGLTQEDLRKTSFFTQIQSSDTIAMVKGKDIASNSIRVRNVDKFEVQFKSYTTQFVIVEHETDPAEALFLLLLRETKDV